MLRGRFVSYEDVSAEIPARYLPVAEDPGETHRFSVLTDLHLASKPWKIKQALRSTESRAIFLLGDSANNGLLEQFAGFRACIEETVPEKMFFPVAGNHDVPHDLRGGNSDGYRNYADFQRGLIAKVEDHGCSIAYDPDGRAYAVRIGKMDARRN